MATMAEPKKTTKDSGDDYRDKMAFAALSGALANKNVIAMTRNQMQQVANACYLMADAMKRARDSDLEG